MIWVLFPRSEISGNPIANLLTQITSRDDKKLRGGGTITALTMLKDTNWALYIKTTEMKKINFQDPAEETIDSPTNEPSWLAGRVFKLTRWNRVWANVSAQVSSRFPYLCFLYIFGTGCRRSWRWRESRGWVRFSEWWTSLPKKSVRWTFSNSRLWLLSWNEKIRGKSLISSTIRLAEGKSGLLVEATTPANWQCPQQARLWGPLSRLLLNSWT